MNKRIQQQQLNDSMGKAAEKRSCEKKHLFGHGPGHLKGNTVSSNVLFLTEMVIKMSSDGCLPLL